MSRSRRTTSRLPLFLSERVSARGVYRAREIDKAWGNRRKSLERRPEVPGFPYVVGENGKWQSPRNDAPAIYRRGISASKCVIATPAVYPRPVGGLERSTKLGEIVESP